MGSKISALTAASALDGTEVVPVVQSSATVKATGQQLMTLITGSSTLSAATVTTSKPLLNHTQTWNDGAVTFTGWKLNITNTASAGSSKFVDFQVGGATKFSVDIDGNITAGDSGMAYHSAPNNKFRFPAGVPGIYNNNVNVFAVPATNRVNLIETALLGWYATAYSDAADTAIYRNAAKVLEINDGTASSYPGTALVLGPQTVAQLPAAAAGIKGARATVTDASATTFMSTVAGGGSNIVPVFCNGTNWLIA